MEKGLAVSKRIVSNFLELSKQRQSIADDPQVLAQVTNSEALILQAGSGVPIAAMELEEYVDAMMEALPGIARDVGITYWQDAERMESMCKPLLTFISTHFRDFTISDIKGAFEFSLTEKLDEFLPKDRNGQPEKGHFQNFNSEYFGRILGAYKRLKRKTWNKAGKLLPEPVDEPTDEERAIYRASFINQIYEKFYLYRDHDQTPCFLVPSLVLLEFKKAGVINGEINVSEENISVGFHQVLADNNISNAHKIMAARKKEQGKLTDEIEAKAIMVAKHELIKRVFDRLIESDMDITDIVK